jgi:hypothetical protein
VNTLSQSLRLHSLTLSFPPRLIQSIHSAHVPALAAGCLEPSRLLGWCWTSWTSYGSPSSRLGDSTKGTARMHLHFCPALQSDSRPHWSPCSDDHHSLSLSFVTSKSQLSRLSCVCRMYGALTGLSKRMVAQRDGVDTLQKWRRGYAHRPPPISSFSASYPGTHWTVTWQRSPLFCCALLCSYLGLASLLPIAPSHPSHSILYYSIPTRSSSPLEGNDDRYVTNVQDVRYSVFESLIRSLGSRRLELHRKFPKAESLKVRDLYISSLPAASADSSSPHGSQPPSSLSPLFSLL